jgi:plastocyanin
MRRIAIALLLLGLSACGGDGNNSKSATVEMRLIALRPEQLTVARGTRVTWSQRDAGVHTATSGTVEDAAGGVAAKPDGRFDSGEIATGKTFEFTFAGAGTYPYFCAIHPATMRGVVTVE